MSVLIAVESLRLAAGSDDNSGWTWFFIVVALGFAGLGVFRDRARTKNSEAVARSLGVPFHREPTKSDQELPIGCSLEQKGCNHVIRNVVEAVRTEDLVLTIFDYEYQPDSDVLNLDNESTTYDQTISRIQSPLLKLPYFNLFPEPIFAVVQKLFGGADINFPESARFSGLYILRGGNEAALRTIFTPALREFLESLRHVTIEGADNVLFVYRWRRRTPPQGLPTLIEENKRLLALFLEGQSVWNGQVAGAPLSRRNGA